jgi:translation initiation factor 5A
MLASKLQKNGHVVIDGLPCKIVSREASQDTTSLAGIDVFTGNLHKCTLSTDETVDVPHVYRKEYQLVCLVIVSWPEAKSVQLNIDDGFLNLVATDGTSEDNVKLPDGDLGSHLCNDFDQGKALGMPFLS